MKIYMLHFGCHSGSFPSASTMKTADACVIGDDLVLAEEQAREAVEEHRYHAGELIAYSQLDESEVATLSDYETALYLKALQQDPKVAVVFS